MQINGNLDGLTPSQEAAVDVINAPQNGILYTRYCPANKPKSNFDFYFNSELETGWNKQFVIFNGEVMTMFGTLGGYPKFWKLNQKRLKFENSSVNQPVNGVTYTYTQDRLYKIWTDNSGNIHSGNSGNITNVNGFLYINDADLGGEYVYKNGIMDNIKFSYTGVYMFPNLSSGKIYKFNEEKQKFEEYTWNKTGLTSYDIINFLEYNGYIYYIASSKILLLNDDGTTVTFENVASNEEKRPFNISTVVRASNIKGYNFITINNELYLMNYTGYQYKLNSETKEFELISSYSYMISQNGGYAINDGNYIISSGNNVIQFINCSDTEIKEQNWMSTNSFGYLASGNNISELTNDAGYATETWVEGNGYLSSGSNISELTNDAGYITSESSDLKWYDIDLNYDGSSIWSTNTSVSDMVEAYNTKRVRFIYNSSETIIAQEYYTDSNGFYFIVATNNEFKSMVLNFSSTKLIYISAMTWDDYMSSKLETAENTTNEILA